MYVLTLVSPQLTAPPAYYLLAFHDLAGNLIFSLLSPPGLGRSFVYSWGARFRYHFGNVYVRNFCLSCIRAGGYQNDRNAQRAFTHAFHPWASDHLKVWKLYLCTDSNSDVFLQTESLHGGGLAGDDLRRRPWVGEVNAGRPCGLPLEIQANLRPP